VEKKIPCIYILTNKHNTVLYTGVTNNLLRRVWEHKNKLVEGFSKQYNLDKLVYYEFFDEMIEAIKREKQVKGGSRKNKMELIKNFNPRWDDLYNTLV
jgi:putative endonuclease